MTLNDITKNDQIIHITPDGIETTRTVERTTKTLIIVDGIQFRRSDGRNVNGFRRRYRSIKPLTTTTH